jgi:hypothetical protein
MGVTIRVEVLEEHTIREALPTDGNAVEISVSVAVTNHDDAPLPHSRRDYRFEVYDAAGNMLPIKRVTEVGLGPEAGEIQPADTNESRMTIRLQGVEVAVGSQYRLVCHAHDDWGEDWFTAA